MSLVSLTHCFFVYINRQYTLHILHSIQYAVSQYSIVNLALFFFCFFCFCFIYKWQSPCQFLLHTFLVSIFLLLCLSHSLCKSHFHIRKSSKVLNLPLNAHALHALKCDRQVELERLIYQSQSRFTLARVQKSCEGEELAELQAEHAADPNSWGGRMWKSKKPLGHGYLSTLFVT